MKRARTTGFSPVILRSLAELQDGLNNMINQSWRTERRLDNWSLAITMETVELIDSYPWKWWKNINAQPDIQNVKIELVDILHFSLSGEMQLRSAGSVPEVSRRPLSEVLRPCLPAGAGPRSETESEIEGASDIMFFPLTNTENAVATFRNIIMLSNIYRFDIITEIVIAAAQDLDFNLIAYYVAKHTLNTIRQMKGYKDGTYVKVRDGVEDNELLHECIASISYEEVADEATYRDIWEKIMHSVFDVFGTPKELQLGIDHWLKTGSPTEAPAATAAVEN